MNAEELKNALVYFYDNYEQLGVTVYAISKNQNIPEPTRWHTYIKLEIMCHELLCFSVVSKSLIHNYSDTAMVPCKIPSYAIEEVITEKLRAMLQRKYTAPRDYYDLWYILAIYKPEVNWLDISENISELFWAEFYLNTI